LRPIGIGEPLRRIGGRVVMEVVKEDIQKPAGSVQLCAGQPGGCEAAIHGMRSIWEDEDTDAVLLIDAANAFNSINREAMLENVSRICPIAYIYAYNCYSVHARLFVLGGAELKSKEGTTQGDPTSMALYAIGSLPFLWLLDQEESGTCQVAYADDLSGGGKVESLRKWFNGIIEKGPIFGYHAEPTKSYLIVKKKINLPKPKLPLKALVLRSQYMAKNSLVLLLVHPNSKRTSFPNLLKNGSFRSKFYLISPSLNLMLPTLPSLHAFDIVTPFICVPFRTLNPSFSPLKMPSIAF
jgi:hypothetical protein